MEMHVNLEDIDSVRQLVGKLDKYECCGRLIDGNTAVDARSLMQIFVLDLTKELLLVIDSDDKCLWKELEIYRSEYMEN